ncbi:hypothetical protein SteCoe_20380 [Stentor coeruleus]|uniref:Uncharacterized protein n=1 Tax=Stentor coeruleus TaxID=5963 RepID=A0A1R2BRW8_9CILI|nr:hypothetical protein SteCoe_20380 [Stentor coeruleus]
MFRNGKSPELDYLERIHEVLSKKTLSFSEMKYISERLQNYSGMLPPISFGILCSKITRSTHKHFFADVLPIAINKIQNGENSIPGSIIMSLSFYDNAKQEDWEILSVNFLKNLKETLTIHDLACIQKILLNWKNYQNHLPTIRSCLEKIPLSPETICLYASIYRCLNDSDMILKVVSYYDEIIESIKFEDMIFTAFHLMQESLLATKTLEKVLNRINVYAGPWNASLLVRIMQIFVKGPENFEQFNPIFHSKILSNLNKFTPRELVNIIHFTVTNPFYAYEPLICDIYKEIIKRDDLKFSPLDYSSLIHALGKNNLDVQPLLKYLTSRLIMECDGNQICIIYHYIFNVAPNDMLNKIKKRILEKIETTSPKNILNVAKDIASDENFNVEYWDNFYNKASKIISQHNDTKSAFYNSQLTTIFTKVKKCGKPKIY